jgi:hypothetical protein
MDLDNIDNVEELRRIAKKGRAKLKKDIMLPNGYIFRKDFWYLVEQDYYGVIIFTDDYANETIFDYEEAEKLLENF